MDRMNVQEARVVVFTKAARCEPDSRVRVGIRRSNKVIYHGLEAEVWPRGEITGRGSYLDEKMKTCFLATREVILIDEIPLTIFVPLRARGYSRTKYLPHQGKKEMLRRRSQMYACTCAGGAPCRVHTEDNGDVE